VLHLTVLVSGVCVAEMAISNFLLAISKLPCAYLWMAAAIYEQAPCAWAKRGRICRLMFEIVLFCLYLIDCNMFTR